MSRLRWVFAGQGLMGAAALSSLLRAAPCPPVTAADAAGHTGAVTAAARPAGVAVLATEAIGSAPSQRWPDRFAGLDVAVCCCWPEVVAPGALAAPAHGWLNLHPSRLPAWRGADPLGWQLLTSPSRIGCSVHRMTERVDDGPVVACDAVSVDDGDDRGALQHRTGVRLGQLAGQVLTALADGAGLEERPQRPDEASWCPPAGTVPMVDPRRTTAAGGYRVARAFSPEPGIAVATLSPDDRFAVSAVGTALAPGEEPGTVVSLDAANVAVAFGDRWLRGRRWREDAPPPAGSA